MATKRELAQEQLNLMDDIRAKANINMVTCGHCGTILLHEMRSINEDNSIECFGCKRTMDLSDCTDYWMRVVLKIWSLTKTNPNLQNKLVLKTL